MERKQRCHYTYVFELFFKRIAAIIAMAVTACISVAGEMAADASLRGELPWGKIILFSLAALLVFGGGVLLYGAFQWRHTFVSLHEDALEYQTGCFLKKRVTLPFEQINTIDMGRNVFEKLAGTCRLKIDTGAGSNQADKNQPEMNLVFDVKEAYNIRRFILCRSTQYEEANTRGRFHNRGVYGEPKWAVHAGAGDFILYGLTSSGIWKLLWLAVIGVCVAAEISTAAVGRAAEEALPLLRNLNSRVEQMGIAKALLGMAAIWLVMALGSDIVTALWAAVRFFDFRVARQGRNVLVRYGLFTEKNYTLQVRNIHALIVRQNFFQQLTGRCSVEAVCLGFGDEKDETALLFPIIKCKELNRMLSAVLPEYITEIQPKERRGAELLFHAGIPLAVGAAAWLVIDRIGAHFLQHMLLLRLSCGIGLVLALISGVMSYCNTALDWNRRVVSVQSGGLHKLLYRIRTDAVQEVQIKTSPVKEMLGLGNYYVHYHGPRFNNVSVSKNISGAYFSELANTVEN